MSIMAAASRAYARQQARTFQNRAAPQQAPEQTCECCGSVLVQQNLSNATSCQAACYNEHGGGREGRRCATTTCQPRWWGCNPRPSLCQTQHCSNLCSGVLDEYDREDCLEYCKEVCCSESE
jgi:hypothetical protein